MHGALRVQSQQSAHAAIAPGAGTERQERTVRVIPVSRKQRERFKVVAISEVAAAFGVSRPTFYKAGVPWRWPGSPVLLN